MYIAFLVAHIISGFTCLVTGIIAALAPKRRGRHTRFGEVYHVSYVVVAVSAIVMSIMHWSSSAYLFYIAIFSYGFAILGYLARKIRWKGWLPWHIIGMFGSYIGIVTATLVVNSPHIPYINQIPALIFWFLPTIVGTPIIIRTVNRYKPRKPKVRSTPMA